MRKQALPRGYYKATKELRKEFPGKPVIMIHWLRHNTDTTKDIHFFIWWMSDDDYDKYMVLLRSVDKASFQSWVKMIYRPRTRREKAIFKSVVATIPHINDVLQGGVI